MPDIRQTCVTLALTVGAAVLFGEARAVGQRGLPPAWQSEPDTSLEQRRRTRQRSATRKQPAAPWRWGSALELGLPEIGSLSAWFFPNRHMAVRAFLGPPVPFDIKVELPQDVLGVSGRAGLTIAHPDTIINLEAEWGPSYGMDALWFPFGETFYTGLGLSHRRLKIWGQATSRVLLCTNNQAATGEVCGPEDDVAEPLTRFTVRASTETTATLVRLSLGWLWRLGGTMFVETSVLGVGYPAVIGNQVAVNVDVLPPEGDPDVNITEALTLLKQAREQEMEDKALEEARPGSEAIMPILRLGFGVLF